MNIISSRLKIAWSIGAMCMVIGLAGCGGGAPGVDTSEQKQAFRGNPNDPAALAANKRDAAKIPQAPTISGAK